MGNKDRYLPALAALSNQSRALRSHEIKDLGTMTYADFWNKGAVALNGCSTLVCSADLDRAAALLRHCGVLENACLILSRQMEEDAEALCALFPQGEMTTPERGGIILWEPGAPALKQYITQEQSYYPVVLMSGLQMSAEVLSALITYHRSSGFLLISQNLRQELAQYPDAIPTVLAADQLILHGPSDPETICASLPQSKINQVGFDTVLSFNNPIAPQKSGKGKLLRNRGGECEKAHGLSLSLAQSLSLVEKPIVEPGELRQNPEQTIVIHRKSHAYNRVVLQEKVHTLTTWLDGVFESWANWEERLRSRR